MKYKNSISVCGINCAVYSACNKCSSVCKSMHKVFDKPCLGCNEIHEIIFLGGNLSLNVCPIYNCVHKKNYKHCGECDELPCELYFELKDIFISDVQHKLDIEHRIKVLKSIQ